MKYHQFRERMVSKLVAKGGVIAEIGVFRGRFSERLLEIAEPKKIYLVDPWNNKDDPDLEESWYHSSSPNDMNLIFSSVCERFSERIDNGQVEILRGTSNDLAALAVEESLDFAYIDGDHRFEGVLKDLNTLASLVKVGGILMLDDYNTGKWWGDGVVRALNCFLGEHPANWRIVRVAGTQIAIRRLQ
ncbi:hypothetical protein RUESEDTHA_00185 [Ruegeria sp. THAF57]|uniref:class I SAM-dependent methyltransferase n=1 Tax=Ruegeria sp. THAF57 TaxID=2744555 RepID=UPI0015DF375D|nr:class I SAM-dependent methyltransferase [Ruegeria sp. THAF57]CAD0183321.1 hypothetical protein RUESEDTHA_00185 [Ruegeria sp. THAF57]